MGQTGTLPQCGNVGWLGGEHQCTDGWVAMHRLVVFRVSIGYLGSTLLLGNNVVQPPGRQSGCPAGSSLSPARTTRSTTATLQAAPKTNKLDSEKLGELICFTGLPTDSRERAARAP